MTNYTPAQLEALTKPYPAKPLILGGNASMDHYETTVWERTVEAMLKRRAEAAPDLARLVLERDAEIARKDAEIAQLQGQVAWLRSAIDHVVAPSHEGNR